MTSVCQIAPFVLPFVLCGQPGIAAPTSASAEAYLFDKVALHPRSGPPALVDSQSEMSVRPLVSFAPLAEWLHEAAIKIDRYADLSDNWKGPGSIGPSEDVREQAKELAGQIALEISGIPRPIIGADDEGAITLHWSTPGMSATLTAYGDGTFSYYAENQETSDRSDSEAIGEPLPMSLVNVMAVDTSLGSLAV